MLLVLRPLLIMYVKKIGYRFLLLLGFNTVSAVKHRRSVWPLKGNEVYKEMQGAASLLLSVTVALSDVLLYVINGELSHTEQRFYRRTGITALQ